MEDRTELRDAVIEQVMRITNDDTLVMPFLYALPGTRAAHSAIGRLLGQSPCALPFGCPLLAYVNQGPMVVSWRDFCHPAATSLWADRMMLIEMYGPPPPELSPYQGLEWLREQEEADLCDP